MLRFALAKQTTAQQRRATQFFRNIYLSLYWKGFVWEGVGDRTELQHIDPHSYGHYSVSFPFSWLLNRGPGGPASLGHVPRSSIFSPTATAQSGAWRPTLLGAGFPLPHLKSNWLNFLCTELYDNLTPTLLPASVTNRTHSIRPPSRLYSDIPRPDAPVIYTGAFPILTARPGRRSIYNIYCQYKLYNNNNNNISERQFCCTWTS